MWLHHGGPQRGKMRQFYLYYRRIWTSKFLPPRIRNDQFADLCFRLKNAHPLTTLKPLDEFDFLTYIFFVCGVDEKIISNFSSTYSDFWGTFINVRETFVTVKDSGHSTLKESGRDNEVFLVEIEKIYKN